MEVWLVSSSTDPSPLQSDGSSSHSLPLATGGQVPPSPAQPDPPAPPQGLQCSIPSTSNPNIPPFPNPCWHPRGSLIPSSLPAAREMLEQVPSQAQGRAGCEETSWSSSQQPSRAGTHSPEPGIAGKLLAAGIPGVPGLRDRQLPLGVTGSPGGSAGSSSVPPGTPSLPWAGLCLQGTRTGRDTRGSLGSHPAAPQRPWLHLPPASGTPHPKNAVPRTNLGKTSKNPKYFGLRAQLKGAAAATTPVTAGTPQAGHDATPSSQSSFLRLTPSRTRSWSPEQPCRASLKLLYGTKPLRPR